MSQSDGALKGGALEGGRIFFSNAGRSLEGEDEIELVSVGVDIGSSTSHLVISRLVLERMDSRYVVASREVLHESDILLTPYADQGQAIDTEALGAFITAQYAKAGVAPDAIDTGALILTGVAVRRRNARAIGELFASQAGRFVSLSAGDALETSLAAFGAGAVAHSIRSGQVVMNIDVGGGTSKIALCRNGAIIEQTAIDIGARLICFDADFRIQRLEPSGVRFAEEIGATLHIGAQISPATLDSMAERMADRLLEAASKSQLSEATRALLRLDPLSAGIRPDIVQFSGGVSEFIYGRQHSGFGDLGERLASALRSRIAAWVPILETPSQGIRATVIGASQYTVQVSGSTIFIDPPHLLPVRNIAVIAPDFDLSGEVIDPAQLSRAVTAALARFDLQSAERPVAVCYRWQGSATFQRLDAFTRGVAAGLQPLTNAGHPLILVGEGDIGGLVGIHVNEEARLGLPVISIDGIDIKEFDFIDIGAILASSGAVPVVIKSLVFPGAGLGRAISG